MCSGGNIKYIIIFLTIKTTYFNGWMNWLVLHFSGALAKGVYLRVVWLIS